MKASVVILTKNAGASFRHTLEALQHQDTDWPYEVVAVDSGSVDGTLDLLSEFAVRVHRIEPGSFDFGRTRDLAFSLARGSSYIATISQDVVPASSEWLAELCRPLDDPTVAAAMADCQLPEGDAFFWERRGLFYFSSETRRWEAKYGHGLSFVSCAVQRSFWAEHRIGATPFGEDKCFQLEIIRAGKRVVMAPDAVSLHGHQYDLRSLIKRLVGEGVGWKHAGENYTLRDCVMDLIKHNWMLRLSVKEFFKGNVRSPAELLFPFLRPVCLCVGNRRARVEPGR